MKIAFICVKGLSIGGGIESFTKELGTRLVARGHEVLVYSSRTYGATDGCYEGIHVKTLPALNTRSAHKLSLALLSTCHQFFVPDIDVVHFHAIGPSVFCVLPRVIGRKTVVQSHGHEWMRAKWNWYGKLFFRVTESVGVLGSHRVTAVSHALTNYYEGKYGVPVTYIPPGVNPATRRPPDLIRRFGLKGADYVLFMARLVEEKGAHYLIDAFNGIDTDLKLVIAGDAQHEERYKAVLEQKASGNPRIVFTGYVSGQLKEELLSNARCYVLPSEIEGLPIALLEVMSYGVCCIASDIPANVEALGGHGLLFRNKDVSDLRRHLTLAITGNEVIQEMGRGGQARVSEQYSWEMVTDCFEALYGDLLAKR